MTIDPDTARQEIAWDRYEKWLEDEAHAATSDGCMCDECRADEPDDFPGWRAWE